MLEQIMQKMRKTRKHGAKMGAKMGAKIHEQSIKNEVQQLMRKKGGFLARCGTGQRHLDELHSTDAFHIFS